jgi:hypothetical protein
MGPENGNRVSGMKLAPSGTMMSAKTILAAAALVCGAAAGENGAPDSSRRETYAALFSELLRSLPPEKRAMVDSAAPTMPGAQAAEASKASKRAENAPGPDNLAPDVQEKVEKAISAMGERKKKALEFKELRR